MVHREIEIDENTDRVLTELAAEYNGDLSHVVADLVHAHQGLQEFAGRSEASYGNALDHLREQAETDFREGRTATWEDVKASNGW